MYYKLLFFSRVLPISKSMLFGMKIFQFHLGGPCGGISSTDGLLHADLGGDEELLHGHRVHVGEVLHYQLLAVVPVAWQTNLKFENQ